MASLVQAGDGLDRWRSQLMEVSGHLVSLAGFARLAEPAESGRLSRLAEAEGGPHIRYEPPISKPEKRTKPA
ncbi:MAG TPA: hypothetical protein VM142_07005 [Acidimicrobiales bacterium]|nr:hypothetical protein [Acidimicrobiales bacterium]